MTVQPSSIVVDVGASRNVKRMSFVRLLCLNAVVCGIEFCGSAAFCFIPPMLLKIGIGEQNMSLVLGVGPLMGFFVVPLIGRWSDRCYSRFGRRRPFIFVLSVVLILSLLVLMSAKFIGAYVFGKELGQAVSVCLLVVGSIFLDFTCQVCLTPCEALLSDLSKDTNQHGRCFTIYSFMVSFGGCIGYLITALDWSNNFLGSFFDSQENCIFFLLILLFSASLILTFIAAKEVPLIELQKISEAKKSGQVKSRPVDGDYANDDVSKEDSFSNSLLKNDLDSLTQLPLSSWSFKSISSLKTFVTVKLYSLLPEVLKQLLDVPFALRRLALANFCSWTSIMIFNLFYTDFVGQAIYHGDPNASEGSDLRKSYDEGVRMGSWGLLWHCILSAVYAAFIDRVISAFNLQVVYFLGMVSFTLSIFIMMFSSNIWLANFCATCTGFGFATLTTVPYLLLTSYHDNVEVSASFALSHER